MEDERFVWKIGDSCGLVLDRIRTECANRIRVIVSANLGWIILELLARGKDGWHNGVQAVGGNLSR